MIFEIEQSLLTKQFSDYLQSEGKKEEKKIKIHLQHLTGLKKIYFSIQCFKINYMRMILIEFLNKSSL
jgi:hypothetical protein